MNVSQQHEGGKELHKDKSYPRCVFQAIGIHLIIDDVFEMCEDVVRTVLL